VTVDKLAYDAIGQMPAKIKEAFNAALELAYINGRQAMTYWDWRRALSEINLGLRQPVPLVERDRKRISYHEAGHAIISWLLRREDYRITSCSIVRYGDALGHLLAVPTTQLFVKSVKEIASGLAVLLGGRAAEELVFGLKMGSMGGDMRSIRTILYGMAQQGMFKTMLNINGTISDKLQQEMDDYVDKILAETKGLLRQHRKALDNLAQTLMEREEIIGEEVEQLLASWEEEDEVTND